MVHKNGFKITREIEPNESGLNNKQSLYIELNMVTIKIVVPNGFDFTALNRNFDLGGSFVMQEVPSMISVDVSEDTIDPIKSGPFTKEEVEDEAEFYGGGVTIPRKHYDDYLKHLNNN